MSAIGILLMIAHHLFGFKEYLADGICWDSMFLIGGIEVERIIAAFGKICVSLFAFNSGYVIWKFRSSYQNPGNCFKRGVSFLLSYWIVLAAFMLYAVAIGESLPTGSDLISNLFGLSTGPDKPFVNIPFAWYVAYYITFISLAPIILLLFTKNPVTDCIVFALMGLVLWKFPISFMSPMMIGLEGVLFAKYAVFQSLAERLSSVRVSVILLIEFAIVILRQGYILLDLSYFNLMGGGRLSNSSIVYTIYNYFISKITKRIHENKFDIPFVLQYESLVFTWHMLYRKSTFAGSDLCISTTNYHLLHNSRCNNSYRLHTA